MKLTELGKVEFVKEGIKKLFKLLSGLVLVPFIPLFFHSEWLGKINWEVYYGIILALFIVLFFLIPNYISIRRKYVTPFKKWTFDQSTGIWSDGEFYYCASCKTDLKVSPLKRSEKGWRCMVKSCQKFYSDPDYKAPPPPRIGSGWIDRY